MTMTNIIIADDHPIVRAGMKQIISEASDLVVAAEASDGRQLLSKIRAAPFDVVILDITMPHMDGLDVLKQLKIEKPKLPVIVLSVHPEDQYALRVLKAGASGYVTKASAPDELINAIRKVCSGGKYISPTIAEKMVFQLDTDFKEMPHEALSDREFQVLRLLASGKSVTQIAEELTLSVKTVSTYRARILEKMYMQNNAELIHYAVQNKLVD
jgi:DNA-binding NarL/FixJ family response regulator